MTGTALGSVQTAIYARLSADTTLMALITGVYDGAPGETAFPYVDIGDGDEVPFRVFGNIAGHETFKTIRIYTQDDKAKVGYKEGQAIFDRVNTLLDNHALSVSGQTTVSCLFEDAFQQIDGDGVTRQIAATYKVTTQ